MKNLVMCVPAEKAYFVHPNNVESICCWLPREEAETNKNYKQVIPYCAIRSEGRRYLSYRRKGNEKRLHGLLSIGVGGHIDSGESMLEGLEREIEEEVGPNRKFGRFIGLVNMDETEVDRVHVGLMFEMQVGVPILGDELRDPEWLSLNELKALRDEMEPWSQVLLDELTNPF